MRKYLGHFVFSLSSSEGMDLDSVRAVVMGLPRGQVVVDFHLDQEVGRVRALEELLEEEAE